MTWTDADSLEDSMIESITGIDPREERKKIAETEDSVLKKQESGSSEPTDSKTALVAKKADSEAKSAKKSGEKVATGEKVALKTSKVLEKRIESLLQCF